MKKQYITPITELVDVNLKGSVLQSLTMGGASDVAKSMSTNESSFDAEQDETFELNTMPNLWDE
jgi:hypothetical protein